MVGLAAMFLSSSRVYADFSGGCYSDTKGTKSTAPCDSSTTDTQGNPLDPTQCYIVTAKTLPPGAQGPPGSAYSKVSCADLTTPIADTTTNPDTSNQQLNLSETPVTKHGCGSNSPNQTGLVYTSLNIGCEGEACANGKPTSYCETYHNAIVDALFAIIRFLSLGVGIIVIGSIVVAGIQFSVSRADPKATSMAIGRIRSSVIALLIYIFAYAILNYLIPKGFFHQ